MKGKIFKILLISSLCMLFVTSCAFADAFDTAFKRWSKTRTYKGEDDLSTLDIRVTYYSAEFIEAYIQKEAAANLWTQQETDDFKYKFLQALRLDEMIPVQIEFNNNAPTMHLGPFDIMVRLIIGRKSYKPADYDKRFNFAFQGKREGLVFFSRYDEKTGKDLLEGAKTVIVELKGAISPPMTNGRDTRFQWDVANDDPSKLYRGTTAARIETDRLIKRLENLRKDKEAEDARLKAIEDEINTIQQRLDELANVQ